LVFQANVTSVLLVDEHPVVRGGLRQCLGEEIRDPFFGEAKNAEEALRAVLKRPWDIIILEVSSPDGEGLDLLRELRRQYPDARILMFGDRQERWCAARSKSLGARGFVSKRAPLPAVRKAVRSVLAGETYFSRSVSSKGPRSSPGSPLDEDLPRKPLSGREKEILMAFCNGKSAGEAAAELGINIKTISTYKRRMLGKLHLGSTVSLIRYAIDNGIC
jgi:two-component system invasion response regulator UvrY